MDRPMTQEGTDAQEPIDAPEEGRITVDVAGVVAELVYEVEGSRLLILHTEVPKALSGRGIGGRLVVAAAAKAKEEGLTVVPWCPFARRWLRENPARAGSIIVDFDYLPSS
jgi:predicted GNAT family acetyltransferase